MPHNPDARITGQTLSDIKLSPPRLIKIWYISKTFYGWKKKMSKIGLSSYKSLRRLVRSFIYAKDQSSNSKIKTA